MEPKDFQELQPRQDFGVQRVVVGCLRPLRDKALGAGKVAGIAVVAHNLLVARWDQKAKPNVHGPAGQAVLAPSRRIRAIYGPSHRLERKWGNPLQGNYQCPRTRGGNPKATENYIARGPGVEGQIYEIHTEIINL